MSYVDLHPGPEQRVTAPPWHHQWVCAAFVLLRASRSKGEGNVSKMLAEYPRMNFHT